MPSTQNYVPMVGVDMLHYAKVTSDTTNEFTTETPKLIPGLTEAGFNMNPQTGTLYADNGPYATAVGLGDFDGAISVADVPPDIRGELYGFEYDNATGELSATDINPPDITIQYRVQKPNGAYRYVTLYKMKATPNEEKVATKGGSINFQTNGFSLKGARRLKDGRLFRMLDTDSPNLPTGVTPEIIEANWFTDVNWEIAAQA